MLDGLIKSYNLESPFNTVIITIQMPGSFFTSVFTEVCFGLIILACFPYKTIVRISFISETCGR